ncbi:MAG: alpha/beta fold hydrolase [Pirellulales bacterium]
MSDRRDSTGNGDWRVHYPFRSHWLNLPLGRLHYLDEGLAATAAPVDTLLFVHGNPTWSFHWRSLISSLRAHYRCVAPDHMGCGWSDKPAQLQTLSDHVEHLVALVQMLNLERVTLVAQDWGGAIGLGALLRMPERLERIVLFNTGAFPPPYIPWRIRACRIPLVGRLAVQGGGLFDRAALRMTLARRRQLDRDVAAGYMAPYDSWTNRRAVYGFVDDIPNGPQHPTWQLLADIEHQLPTFAERPALVVWGMRDWCFRPDCLARFERAWPQAEVHRLADVGHWVLEDAPEEAVPLVREFLARTDRDRGELLAAANGPGASDHE